MAPNQYDDFIKALNRARGLRDKVPLTQEVAEEWLRLMKGHTLAECLRALDIHSTRNKWAASPADLTKIITGDDRDGGFLAQSSLCSIDGCGEKWAIQIEQKNFCRRHYDAAYPGKNVSEPYFGGHHWQEVMGCARCIDKFGEARAERAYSKELVAYVLDNSEAVLALMPDPAKAPTKPLPMPQRAA